MRMRRADNADAPLRRRVKMVRHEKEWMKRKRLKAERRYSKLQQGVEELQAYIKFINQDEDKGKYSKR